MRFFKYAVIICFLASTAASGETVKLVDGRVVNLKDDGSYEFIDTPPEVIIEAASCKTHKHIRENEDEFGEITDYTQFVGFSLQYKIVNRTDIPLVVRRLATESSKDYGFFYTEIEIVTFQDAIEPGESLFLDRDPHLYAETQENKMTNPEVKKLVEEYGCSNSNLSNHTIFVDFANTEMSFPPNAELKNPLDYIVLSSEIDGLSLTKR